MYSTSNLIILTVLHFLLLIAAVLLYPIFRKEIQRENEEERNLVHPAAEEISERNAA